MAFIGPTFLKGLVYAVLALFFCSIRLEGQLADFTSTDFTKADSVAALYPHHSLHDLKELSDKLSGSFSGDVDKFRAIYTWVCLNIETDYGFYIKNKYKREKLKDRPEELRQWNEKSGPRFFKKLLHQHKTVCTGYAYLLKELAYHAGIRCEIIDGYGRTVQTNIGGQGVANHSWNAVQLNEQWYLCDATWSSGAINPKEKKYIKQFNDIYFLTAPPLFAGNHYPLDTSWILLKQKPTLQEFLNKPLLYKAALSHKVLPLLPETFDISLMKGDIITFQFSNQSKAPMEQVTLQIIQGSMIDTVYPEVQQDADELYHIDHTFRRKGTYVVHLLLSGDHLFTYSVKVSK